MKKKMVVMVLAFLAMIATVVATVNAEQGTVGVKVGDWAEYSFDLWAGTSHFNETVKVEVTSIVSTTIYYSLTWDPPVSDTNDAQLNLLLSNTGSINVQTRESSGSYAGYFIAVNDSGVTIGGTAYAMSRTEPRPMQYLGQSFWITHMTASGNDIQEDLYWIKSTGVLVELEISGSGFSLTMHITSVIPEFTTPLLLLVLVATTLPATMVLRKKFKRTSNP